MHRLPTTDDLRGLHARTPPDVRGLHARTRPDVRGLHARTRRIQFAADRAFKGKRRELRSFRRASPDTTHAIEAARNDPEAANQLLDRFGYRKASHGYRRLPGGKPLVVTYASQTTPIAREFDELWKKAFDALGIRLKIEKGKLCDQIRAAIVCQHQLWSYGWIADYPDGDNFMQLL
jgi:hypothetical protein